MDFLFVGCEVFHNAKSKIYPNGTIATTVCNRKIFKDENFEPSTKCVTKSKPQNKNNEVRADSVQRSKRKVFDIGMMNFKEWKYFVTLTIDGSKIDRNNTDEVHRILHNYLRNMVQRYNMKYLLVPEYHSDGTAIHCHMLCCGDFPIVDSGTVYIPGFDKPVRLETALKKCSDKEKWRIVYNLPQWNYGFSTAVKLYGDIENAIKYIIKYVTKDSKKIFGNFYLAGGKDLIRKVPYKVHDIDFDNLEAIQYDVIEANMSFKYINEKKGVETNE